MPAHSTPLEDRAIASGLAVSAGPLEHVAALTEDGKAHLRNPDPRSAVEGAKP